MRFRPTPAEERWLALARRLDRNPSAAPFQAHCGGWRSAKLLSRCLFFGLGLVTASMLAVVLQDLFGTRITWVATGLLCCVIAEWLVTVRRNFGSGFEEALEVTGLAMLAFECVGHSHVSDHVAAALMGAAFGLAGVRLLNPLFTTASMLALLYSLHAPPLATAVVCYAIGGAALAIGGRSFRRPAYDYMLDALVVAMPVAGYLWSTSSGNSWLMPEPHGGEIAPWLAALGVLLFALSTLVIGLRRRAHAPLIAFMLCAACLGFELHRLTRLAPEKRLIIGGCVVLLVSAVLERWLREPRRGITSRPIRADAPASRVVDLAGGAVLTPNTQAPQTGPAVTGGGGRFSGGGASGTF